MMENKKNEGWVYLNHIRKAMECIKTVTEANYEVSDEAYHTLKRIVKKCEKLIKAYEKKLAQREKEREKALNR